MPEAISRASAPEGRDMPVRVVVVTLDKHLSGVAKRAGVAPATAYTYFASKEHLVAEVFWRRFVGQADRPIDRRRSPAARATATSSLTITGTPRSRHATARAKSRSGAQPLQRSCTADVPASASRRARSAAMSPL